MSLSYEYSIGSVRAREKHLFSHADIEQMIALRDEKNLLSYLKDKGFGEGDSIEDLLESNRQKMWRYLRSVAPDFEIFQPFLLQNDIHNLKTILKGVMSDRDYEELLMEPCTVPHQEMVSIVENRRFDKLPKWLSEAGDKAYLLLAETKDARLSDAYIDRAVLGRLLECARTTKSVFLKEYFTRMVFYANVKTALRASKMKLSEYFLEKSLCECEGFDKSKVIRLALKGHDDLVKYLAKLDVYDCRKAMEAYAESPVSFEKLTDNQLIQLARKLCRYASEGPEPMMGYFIGCEYERKLIGMIASGLKTNAPPEQIRERLREIYG